MCVFVNACVFKVGTCLSIWYVLVQIHVFGCVFTPLVSRMGRIFWCDSVFLQLCIELLFVSVFVCVCGC